MKGTLLGSEIEVVTTFWSLIRPNGTAYAQGDSVQTAATGDIPQRHGSGVGRTIGPGMLNYSYGLTF
jgi:hypothetical protein